MGQRGILWWMLTNYLVAVGTGRGAGMSLNFGNNVLLVTKCLCLEREIKIHPLREKDEEKGYRGQEAPLAGRLGQSHYHLSRASLLSPMMFPTEEALRRRVLGAYREKPVCVRAQHREDMSWAWTMSAAIFKLEGHQEGH